MRFLPKYVEFQIQISSGFNTKIVEKKKFGCKTRYIILYSRVEHGVDMKMEKNYNFYNLI